MENKYNSIPVGLEGLSWSDLVKNVKFILLIFNPRISAGTVVLVYLVKSTL